MKEDEQAVYLLIGISLSGLLYGAINLCSVIRVEVKELKIGSNGKEVNSNGKEGDENENEGLTGGEGEGRSSGGGNVGEASSLDPKILSEAESKELQRISNLISEGADEFLFHEYLYIFFFVMLFGTLILLFAETIPGTYFTTISFVTGALTSILCGYIGMKIATKANVRTCYKAYFGLGHAFKVAYQGGCVLGFVLVSMNLLALLVLIVCFKGYFIHKDSKQEDFEKLFECIAGFGLGASSVALFCRVGGGIYTKAADVGADLVSKNEYGIEEDDPRNPATIADNVGDNVGDIAGMGSDLYGSLAESTCAALLVGATSEALNSFGFYYPLLLTAAGILVCIFVTQVGLLFSTQIQTYWGLEWTIKLQLILSALIMLPCIYLITLQFVPEYISIGTHGTVMFRNVVTRKQLMICPAMGLISGMFIGIVTEYYTSKSTAPVLNLVNACKQGPAINIILGLALGYVSNIIPTFLIAGTVYASYYFAGMYGIALAAIGMLGNLCICLAIDGFGPISDNAGGLSEMAHLDHRIRETTDLLDCAGNTTAAIGKGFAIGSACLVAFSLYGAFITRTKLDKVILNTPIIFAGLLVGAMIPYLFAAFTMKAVGQAASEMVDKIRENFENNEEPKGSKKLKEGYVADPKECIRIATSHSLCEMILPGLLVILTPIATGVLFGPKAVAGLLIGIIISGIQIAISSANSGGAWDNCKKSIKNDGISFTRRERYLFCKKEVSRLEKKLKEPKKDLSEEDKVDINRRLTDLKTFLDSEEVEINRLLGTPEFAYINEKKLPKAEALDDSKPDLYTDLLPNISHKKKYSIFVKSHKASVVGDTVGDPLKDTSGPSLNILIKLSSIISVVFGSLFLKTAFLVQN